MGKPRDYEDGPDPADLPVAPPAPPMPDLLARPVDHPRAHEILGGKGLSASDRNKQMTGWAISMNFAFAVMGMALLGWAFQKWVWPASAPWALLVALAMGLLGGFIQFVRQGLAANRE